MLATIQFDACNRKIANCGPTLKDRNYTVRLYCPRECDLEWHTERPRIQGYGMKSSLLEKEERMQ